MWVKYVTHKARSWGKQSYPPTAFIFIMSLNLEIICRGRVFSILFDGSVHNLVIVALNNKVSFPEVGINLCKMLDIILVKLFKVLRFGYLQIMLKNFLENIVYTLFWFSFSLSCNSQKKFIKGWSIVTTPILLYWVSYGWHHQSILPMKCEKNQLLKYNLISLKSCLAQFGISSKKNFT